MNDKLKTRSAILGFTLIEILVAISISGIIFLAASALLVSLVSSNARVSQLDAMSQVKDDIAKDLSNSIRWASDIVVSTENDGITITDTQGDSTTYRTDTNRLLKNDTPIHSDEFEVTQLSVHDYSAGGQASLEIQLAIRSKKFTARNDTIRLVVSQRQTRVTINN